MHFHVTRGTVSLEKDDNHDTPGVVRFTRPTMNLTGQQHAQALAMPSRTLENPSSNGRHIGTSMMNGVYFCEPDRFNSLRKEVHICWLITYESNVLSDLGRGGIIGSQYDESDDNKNDEKNIGVYSIVPDSASR